MARSKKNDSGLTPIQAKFCEEYLVDLKAKAAAIRAGYSEKSAVVKASQLLAMQQVQAHLDFLRGEEVVQASRKAGVSTPGQVLSEIDRGAMIDPGLMFDAKGNFLPVPAMPEAVRKAIDKFTIQEVTRVEESPEGVSVTITTRTMACSLSKTKDKEMMAKHHKLLVDKVEFGADADFFALFDAALGRIGK
jgi:phage terminase small subunit